MPEGSSMLIAAADQRPIPDSDKMSHLNTLLTGKAKSAITGMGYSGQFYCAAWRILERIFERTHYIIDAPLESLRKAVQMKPHNSTGLTCFSVIVTNFVIVLKEYKQIGDLQPSSTLCMEVGKLLQVLKENSCFYLDDKEYRTDLIMVEKWLSRIAFVLERFFSFQGRAKRRRPKKHNNFRACSNVKETKQMQSNHSPLADDTCKILSFPKSRNMNMHNRYATARTQRLCYGYLAKGQGNKDYI